MKQYNSKAEMIEEVANMSAKTSIKNLKEGEYNLEKVIETERKWAEKMCRFDNGMGVFPPKYEIRGYGYVLV